MTVRVRFSTLKHLAQSPAHFRYWHGREMEPSAAMLIGTATHTMVLGGDTISVYEKTRRGSEWEAFKAAQRGHIVSSKELAVATECYNAVRRNAAARELIDGGKGTNERLIEWDFNGVPFRSTPDRYYGPSDASTLVELKTTRSAEPGAFVRDATRRHYASQLGVYRAALATVGVTVTRAVIVAVETVPPYCVTVLELTERALDVGYRTACGWLEQYKVCAATDEWPGYVQAPVPFDIVEEEELDWSGLENDE